ncbi:MAG: Mth938-like domain-containing protein [Pseudomonadota bacterium]
MRLEEIEFEGQPPIDSYGPGFFRVMDHIHEGPLLLLPDGIKKWDGLKQPAPLLKATLEVLFVGTGTDISPLPKALRSKLEKAEIPFEVMGTPSAARTYNVLLSEGRHVGAALLPV